MAWRQPHGEGILLAELWMDHHIAPSPSGKAQGFDPCIFSLVRIQQGLFQDNREEANMRLIDADALISLIQEEKIEGKILDIIKALGDGLQAETLNQACDRHLKIINSLPIIDAVPVVRCIDCVYASLGSNSGYCNLHKARCKENDYCSYAERVEYEQIKAGIYEF